MREMNLSQLKTGMILELRNGKRFLTLIDTPTYRRGTIMIQGTNLAVSMNGDEEQIDLIQYSYHLYHYGTQREMDIMRVLLPKYPAQLFSGKDITLLTMWEREENRNSP